MKRRKFVDNILKSLAVSSFLTPTSYLQADQKKPNVIFFFTDDHQYNAVNALNNPEVITPNLDKLVKNGTVFTEAHIFGSQTAAVCCPSRAMLMTGRNHFELPMTVWMPWKVPEEEKGICPYITFPEVFRKAGYQTFGTGKQHNGTRIFKRGFTAGGKLFFNGMHNIKLGGHATPHVSDFDPTGKYEKTYVENKFSTELYSDAAIDFIKDYNSNQPIMMYISYTAPHDPWMAPEKYQKMYSPEKISIPENFSPEHPFDNGKLRVRLDKQMPHPKTPESVQEMIAKYYAMVTHLDHHIGRVMKAAENKGFDETNTLFIFAGDNGMAVGQHGLMGKQNVYEHGSRIPLVLSGPGIPMNKKIDSLCYLHDLFPTLCEMIDQPIPDTVTSRSILPLIKGTKKVIYDSQFYFYASYQRSLRKDNWKLIRYNVDGKRTDQLFDLKNDPLEIKNLVDNPEFKDKFDELKKLLIESGKKLKDAETWYH